jgi:NTP pyrophosphatase (non-canonical NTP hydrolase)
MKNHDTHLFANIHSDELNSAAHIQGIFLQLYGTYDIDKSCLWLTEEVGEFIAAIRKGKVDQDIFSELCDITVWTFILANSLGYDMRKMLEYSLRKESGRQMQKYGKLKYQE